MRRWPVQPPCGEKKRSFAPKFWSNLLFSGQSAACRRTWFAETHSRCGLSMCPGPSRRGRRGRRIRPVPYFVSLAAGEVNLRTGPGVRYPIDWVYKRRALPVEVIAVFDHWRQIRDWQGTVGWVHQNMLSTRRTLIVVGEERVMRREPKSEAAPVARLAPGVVANPGLLRRVARSQKLPVIPGGSAARRSGAPCRRKRLSSVASASTPTQP